MSSSPKGSPPRLVISTQYFIYFGVLGMFLPFFNLYCFNIGLSGLQIGSLSALRSVTLVVFPLIWGALADRFHCRRPIYIACNMAGTVVWGFFLLTTDFWLMFLVTAVYGAFYAPVISFLETFTMETLGRAKSSYGRIRAWGSISFIAVVIILGRAIDLFSVDIILTTIWVGSAAMAVFSLKIPAVKVASGEPLRSHATFLLRPQVVVFLFSAFLMLVSHGTYYGFFSIHLEALGYGKTFIGLTWALASTAEILVMLGSASIFQRFRLEHVLMFSFGVAVLRWLALAVVTSPAGILITQVLHALTYGTFHMASILYIDQLSPEKAKTIGQAANNAVTYGMGLTAGFFLNGWLYESVGAHVLFAASAGIALAGGLILNFNAPLPHRQDAT